MFEGVASAEGLPEVADLGGERLDECAELCAVGELDVLLREVEFEFEECGEVEQLLAELLEFVCVGAAELADGEGVLLRCGGVYEVGEGFGLREVEFAVAEGAEGELAGLSEACAAVDECGEESLLEVEGAVAGEFDGFFAGEAVRCGEVGGDAVVDIGDAAVGGVSRLEGVNGEDAECDGECVGAAEADDGDAADARGCGDGGDGVIVHRCRGICRRRAAASRRH